MRIDSRGARLALAASVLVCLVLLSPTNASAQSITGMVAMENDGGPMSGVLVRLLDTNYSMVDSTRTDVLGQFRFVEEEGPLYVQAEAEGYNSFLSRALDPGTRSEEVLIALRSLHSEGVEVTEWEGRPGLVLGRVYREGDGKGVEAARIRIGGRETTTDTQGHFYIDDVEPGVRTVSAMSLGHAEVTSEMVVEGGRAYQVDIPMAVDPIDLEGITVAVRSRAVASMLRNVWFRMDHNQHLGGIFIDRHELDLRGNQPLGSILQGLPGAKVVRVGPGQYLVGLRGSNTCRGNPTMFIDGVKLSRNQDFLDLDIVPTMDIEIVEIYRGAASLPAEFGGSDGRCGAIAIWTRRGG